MHNAVIYARYSSHGQNEQTIEGQIRVCKEYAQYHNYNVINIYVDKHKTGTDVNRPEFQRMIEDSKYGTFDTVIVYMIDRFSRNRYYSTIYNWKLQQNGVKVVSATQNISESEEGEFYQMFLEWEAEKYSKRLSKRVREGLTTSVANGTFTGGYLIYGYKIVEKNINGTRLAKFVEPDEEKAPIVKFIFEQYAQGKSKKDIATELNNKGYRYNGKPFVAKNFEKMLVNPKYTGVYNFGDRICENTYPQLINDELFQKVQQRLQSNKHLAGTNSAREPYLLTGKIFCGHCGEAMVAGGGTGKLGKKYHYYSCKNRKKHLCNKQNEDKGFLEWYAVEQTIKYLQDPRRVNLIAKDVVQYYELRTDSREIKRLQAEKIKVQKEIDNAVNVMISTSNTDTHRILDNKIAELATLLEDLSQHQAQLEFERKLEIVPDDIVNFITEFLNGDILDKAFQKRIIDNLVNAFYVYDDKVVIYFNVCGGQETSFIGKADTDTAIEDITETTKGVQTLPLLLRQERQCLNPDTVYYIFVKGIAGIVVKRKDR